MPRLTFVITDLDAGGAERALFELATRLHGHDAFEVAVVNLMREGALAPQLRQAGVRVDSLGWHSFRDVRKVRQLRRVIAATQPDIVHSYLFHANFLAAIVLPKLHAQQQCTIPLVMSHRVAERGKRWHLWLLRASLAALRSKPIAHVAVSTAVRSQIIDQLPGTDEAVSVIYNGVNFAKFANAEPDATAWGPDFAGAKLLAIGRLTPQKNFLCLIDAVQRLRRVGTDLRLCIAGDGELRKGLQAAIEGDAVRLLGSVPDTGPLYRAADLFVLSSKWEGLPNVVLEAAAAGCPIVSTDADGVSDVLPKHELCGTTGSELAAAIERALVNPHPAEEIRKLQGEVSERFTWDRHVADHRRIYARLLDRRPTDAARSP